MHAILQPNFHQEISLHIPVVCQPRKVPRMVQSIHKRLHKHTQLLPRVVRPRNDERQEHGLPLRAPGGRLSGIANTGQQLYGLDDIPYGFNPSPDMAILTFPASAASSRYSSSNDFHASPSDGCTIFLDCTLYLPCATSSFWQTPS